MVLGSATITRHPALTGSLTVRGAVSVPIGVTGRPARPPAWLDARPGFAEAVATVLGELPDLPFLPELPARGLGADMIGRTAALLVDLAVEAGPQRYQVTPGPAGCIAGRSTCCSTTSTSFDAGRARPPARHG